MKFTVAHHWEVYAKHFGNQIILFLLAPYSPWGRKELDTTERLHFHFTLSQKSERKYEKEKKK